MKLNLPFVLVICQFGENCIGVRRAQIYHLKWVEKNHARKTHLKRAEIMHSIREITKETQ